MPDKQSNENESSFLAFIPSFMWGVAIIAIVLVLIVLTFAVGYYHHASVNDFTASWLDAFFLVLKITGALLIIFGVLRLIYSLHDRYHYARMMQHTRSTAKLKVKRQELQNDLLQTQIDVMKQAPNLLKYAIDAGHNVKVGRTGEIEVQNYLSNVHTMSGVEGTATRGYLNAGQAVKPSISELVDSVKRNSFEVAIGKSLTTQEVITVELPDKHIKVIGATRMGKSCMIASIIEQLRQTHDRQHLLLAILDLEDMTGRLFENDTHILKIETEQGITQIHARNVEQVASYIIMLHSMMLHRYEQITKRGIEFMDAQPRILIYFEEFLYWKRLLAQFVPDERKRQAAIGAVTGIATRGLKVGMHLAVSAQVDYADKDFLEAMAQFVGINVSFAVKPSSARAAGFVSTDLLNKNFEARSPGQYVVEMIGGSDMGIAPDYDVKALVKALPHAIPGAIPLEALPGVEQVIEGEVWEHSRSPLIPMRTPNTDTSYVPPVAASATQEENELQQVVTAWEEGSKSIMKVMAVTGLGQNKTRVLLSKAKVQGLIED
jgi:hypothetical protein